MKAHFIQWWAPFFKGNTVKFGIMDIKRNKVLNMYDIKKAVSVMYVCMYVYILSRVGRVSRYIDCNVHCTLVQYSRVGRLSRYIDCTVY